MPLCPQCLKDVTKRKNEACPHCGEALLLYKGHFYRAGDGAPNLAIIADFERRVGQQLSRSQNVAIPFRFNRKSPQYKIELVTAESLLAECDYDLDLARRALHELFNNQAWSWKSRNIPDPHQERFPRCSGNRTGGGEIADADALRQQHLAQQLNNKENVFG